VSRRDGWKPRKKPRKKPPSKPSRSSQPVLVLLNLK